MAQRPRQKQFGAVTLPRAVIGKARSQNTLSGRDANQKILADNVVDVNNSIKTLRQGTQGGSIIRQLYDVDGLVSSLIVSLVRIAATPYKIKAYTTGTNQLDPAAVNAAESLISAWDTVWDYTKGYSDKPDMQGLIETLLLECALTSGVGLELVLDDARLPASPRPFAYDTLEWKSDGKDNRFPSQRRKNAKPGQSPEVDLNIPTVWVGEVMKSASRTYNVSFLVSSLRNLYHYDEFIEDMRRVVRQSGQPRLLVQLNYEKVVNSAPADVRTEPAKLQSYLEDTRSAIETVVRNLDPEDALVYYDLAEVDTASTAGEKADYKELLEALAGITASSMKANPSVLGLRMGSGSQNLGSVESMLFTKTAATLHAPVQKVLSRALTLAVRLLGIDAYVKFEFDSIDLRPELEMEAHKAIRQNRVLELLSIGFLTDEEAAIALGTGARPPGAPQLSGTFFYKAMATQTPTTNQDTHGRQVASQTPTAGGGSDNEERPG